MIEKTMSIFKLRCKAKRDYAELPRAIGRAIFDMRQMWKLEIKNGRRNKQGGGNYPRR